MKNNLSFVFSIILLLTFYGFGQAQDVVGADYWPQWRGPLANGVALKGNPPVKFGENQNLKWKIPIPGKGHATPIVWEDKIIIETATPHDANADMESFRAAKSTDLVLDYKVIMVDLNSGDILWETTVATEKPREDTHELGSWASNSPCTDGEKIYAYFGSRGLYCMDFDGNILWKKDFGQMEKKMNFGEGASPYLYKNKIFIQWDHEGDSYLYALDTKTGNEVWTKKRDVATSWSTPLVVEVNGKPQLIACATNSIISYDVNTGDVIWTGEGLTDNVIPNPKYDDGVLYVISGFRGNKAMAIDIAKAKGNITGTDAVLWTIDRDCPYTPDNMILNGRMYFMRANNGEFTCVDTKTGEVIYSKVRLEGISDLYSSPTGVGDKIYIVSDGICLVVKAGDTYELLSSNELDDDFHASPVIVGDKLLLRGFHSLYCFED